jgi:hypothetical protein
MSILGGGYGSKSSVESMDNDLNVLDNSNPNQSFQTRTAFLSQSVAILGGGYGKESFNNIIENDILMT